MPRDRRQLQDWTKVREDEPPGTRKTVTESDIESLTLRQGEYRTIFTATSTESAKYGWGHGRRDRSDPNAGYFHIELHETGAGSGAADTDLDSASYRFVVYEDSESEIPVVGPSYSETELANAANSNRTEKPVLPLQSPFADKDSDIALQIRADDSDADGTMVDGTQSSDDVQVPYSMVLD